MVWIANFVLFLGFLISVCLYFPLNKRKSKFYWTSTVDKQIPLVPIFIIPYEFYLLYLPISVILLWGSLVFTKFLIAFILANATASIFWYFFPNGVRRPKIRRKGIFLTLVRDLYNVDRFDTNAFPSNHVYGVTICSFFLSSAYPTATFVFVTIGLLVIFSTILVKQHHIADAVAGFVWAVAAILISQFIG